LDRPAWRNRRRGGKVVHQRVPGEAITLRLIVSRVSNVRGETVAVWYLLTNVPSEIPAETVALWYYWRWRIESFFKLLKSAGQQLEHWQQESGEAIAKRPGGGHGLCAGMENRAPSCPGSCRAAQALGATQRPPDEVGQRAYGPGPARRAVGLSGHVGNSRSLQRCRPPGDETLPVLVSGHRVTRGLV